MTIQDDLNKLVYTDRKSNQLPALKQRAPIPVKVGVALLTKSGNNLGGGSGLIGPLVHDVVTTKIVTIPVPLGATSVDVEVMQNYTLTDANGAVYPVSINNYPPA